MYCTGIPLYIVATTDSLSVNVISNTKNTLAGQMNELATLWELDKNTPTTNTFFKGIWKINENNAVMIVE